LAKFNLRLVSRWKQALFVGFASGVLCVLVDIDHVLGVVFFSCPFIPQEHQYGCRLLHPYFVPVGWGLIGAYLALMAGWILYLVYNADGSTPAIDTETIMDD
jgi:hypothetical protein